MEDPSKNTDPDALVFATRSGKSISPNNTQVLDGSVRDAVEKIGGELFTIVHRPGNAGAVTA